VTGLWSWTWCLLQAFALLVAEVVLTITGCDVYLGLPFVLGLLALAMLVGAVAVASTRVVVVVVRRRGDVE
jgi:hypothetical protein